MSIYSFINVILFTFSTATCLPGNVPDNQLAEYPVFNQNDTLKDNQILYNGKLWTNRYYRIKGDPYFLTGEFLSGSITFCGKAFPDQLVRYDIFNDEIILWINTMTIIILNKEMIDSVTLNYKDKKYKIVNRGEDTTSIIKGLVNIYYDGPTTLLVKYKKMIDLLAVEKKYDLFYPTHHLYIKKDDITYSVSGKRDLLKILEDKSVEVRDYIKKKKLIIMRKEPETFIPVLKYYDSLKQ